MDSVVPATMAMSVITAALLMKPSGAVIKTNADVMNKGLFAIFSGVFAVGDGQQRSSASVNSAASSGPRRAANSLTPNTPMLSALSQNDSGGLPQNGTPVSNIGVSQLPLSSITRAISA